MNKTYILAVLTVIFLSGCSSNSYEPQYDNRSNYDRQMDYAAQDAVYDASKSLSAQDIKNINNL